MKIYRLELENYQGIRALLLNLNGQDMDAYGDNETGKTTIANAINWTLTGAPFEDVPGYNPKTIAGEEDMHNAEHSAELECETEAGERVTLKKVYREEYINSRKRGVMEFKGNTTDYFIDSVPVSAGEYQSRVATMIGKPEVIQLLSRPDFFASTLHWTKRREILINVCGDVTPADVISSAPGLEGLTSRMVKPGGIGSYEIDDLKKIAKQTKERAKQDRDRIGPRIDEARRTINEDLTAPADLDQQISEAQLEIERITAEHARNNQEDSAELELRKRIANLENQRDIDKHAHEQSERERLSKHQKEIDRIWAEIKKAQSRSDELAYEAKKLDRACSDAESNRNRLMEKYNEISNEVWMGSENCPTCNQALPTEKLEEIKATFNRNRSKRLEEIITQGKEYSKDNIQILRTRLVAKNTEIAAANAEEEKLRDQLAAANQQEPAAKSYQDEFLEASIAALKKVYNQMLSGAAADNTVQDLAYQNAIKEARKRLEHLQWVKAQLATNAQQRGRIAELEKEETLLAAAYEEAEHTIELCELFTTTKAKLLDQKINDRFHSVRFRIFKPLVNGGIEDTCEVLVPSQDGNMVPFSQANHAGKINAGLEIIDVLGEAYGRQMPIIVDNAESITKLRKTSAQTIRLVVSEADKKLRFEFKLGA